MTGTTSDVLAPSTPPSPPPRRDRHPAATPALFRHPNPSLLPLLCFCCPPAFPSLTPSLSRSAPSLVAVKFVHLRRHSSLFCSMQVFGLCSTRRLCCMHAGCGVLVGCLMCSHVRVQSGSCTVMLTFALSVTGVGCQRVAVLVRCVLCVHRDRGPVGMWSAGCS